MSAKDLITQDFKGKLSEDRTQIILDFPKVVARVLRPLADKELIVRITEYKKKRSDAQNRWLWGVAYVTIAQFLKETQGEKHDKEAIHAHNLKVILGYTLEPTIIAGEEVFRVVGKTTSKLNTQEFSDMADKLVAYWAERGCEIPLPEDDNFFTDFVKEGDL